VEWPLMEGPLKDGLELSLIFFVSGGLASQVGGGGGGGGGWSITSLCRGAVRYRVVNLIMHFFRAGDFSSAA
jgi:hypothetical protein